MKSWSMQSFVNVFAHSSRLYLSPLSEFRRSRKKRSTLIRMQDELLYDSLKRPHTNKTIRKSPIFHGKYQQYSVGKPRKKSV